MSSVQGTDDEEYEDFNEDKQRRMTEAAAPMFSNQLPRKVVREAH